MMSYIQRSIEPVLREMAAQFPAVAVTGPRQSGKSTLVQQVFPRYACVTLDDPLALQQAVQDPEHYQGPEGVLSGCRTGVLSDRVAR